MSSMQLRDIREMGEAMTRARELCLEAQYEKGLAMYQTTLQTLSQFIRRMTKMSERQPWLQMQIELENELNLITDYVELTQAFKIHDVRILPPKMREIPMCGRLRHRKKFRIDSVVLQLGRHHRGQMKETTTNGTIAGGDQLVRQELELQCLQEDVHREMTNDDKHLVEVGEQKLPLVHLQPDRVRMAA
eukprot:jgi/Phyca11/19072/fgenesh1_pg.PHYCAscaffold_43_\